MIILDGKILKLKILDDLKKKISMLHDSIKLVVIQVGSDSASDVYISQKKKMADMVGICFFHVQLKEDISEEELISIIKKFNCDSSVHGIIVQFPIPKHIDCKVIQNTIDPVKDVDGLNDLNMGRIIHNIDCLCPCTPLGIMELLKFYDIDVSGKCVTIIGRSDLVGKPLVSMMMHHDATVILCHSKTKDLTKYTKMADILVCALGKPKFIKENMVKKGSVVIDVGIHRLEDGKLCGDVDFNSVCDKISYITPVPGGVGQMTVAMVGMNTYKAYMLQKKYNI